MTGIRIAIQNGITRARGAGREQQAEKGKEGKEREAGGGKKRERERATGYPRGSGAAGWLRPPAARGPAALLHCGAARTPLPATAQLRGSGGGAHCQPLTLASTDGWTDGRTRPRAADTFHAPAAGGEVQPSGRAAPQAVPGVTPPPQQLPSPQGSAPCPTSPPGVPPSCPHPPAPGKAGGIWGSWCHWGLGPSAAALPPAPCHWGRGLQHAPMFWGLRRVPLSPHCPDTCGVQEWDPN